MATICSANGSLALLCASLFVPSDAAVRGTEPRRCPLTVYAHVRGPRAIVRRGHNPGAIAIRTRTPSPGKVLAVHKSRAAAGLLR